MDEVSKKKKMIELKKKLTIIEIRLSEYFVYV